MVRMLETVGERNYAGEDNYIIQQVYPEGGGGEIALWRAVITQALMDAGSHSAKPDHRRDRREAIAWLSGGSEDFCEVCMLADKDPEDVRKKAREAIGRNCTWRNNPRKIMAQRKEHLRRISELQNPVSEVGRSPGGEFDKIQLKVVS